MARPQTISRIQILEAARTVFLREGVGASTATIAREAGVSEGTIFNRFETKERLFREALGLPNFDLLDELSSKFETLPLEEALERVVLRIIEGFREAMPRIMMVWAHSTRSGKEGSSFLDYLTPHAEGGDPMPLALLRRLTLELERAARRGELRELDPEVLARAVIGSSHDFVWLELLGLHERAPFAATSYARALVDLLLRGASAPSEKESINE